MLMSSAHLSSMSGCIPPVAVNHSHRQRLEIILKLSQLGTDLVIEDVFNYVCLASPSLKSYPFHYLTTS